MNLTYVLGPSLGTPTDTRRVIDLGADHPGRSGTVEIDVQLDGDVVVTASVRPGAGHRSAEKLFEVRDYRQLLALANRHDWQAPFSGELGAALTIEAALHLTPPPRATWLRTVLAEHSRLHSHLGFLSGVPGALSPDPELAARVHAAREALRLQQASLTGNRVHPMACRLGGLAVDADDAWLDAEREMAVRIGELAGALRAHTVSADLPRGVAVLDEETIRAYGVTGPAARAGGVDLDLRRTAPYLAYGSLDVPAPVAAEPRGDAVSRLLLLTDELGASAHLVQAACDGTAHAPGPVSVKLPKVVRVPVGDTYLAHEAPLGRAGYWLVSRGEKVPWRLKLRTASFANAAVLESVLPSTRVDDLPLALASLGYVVGDLAK